MTKEGSLGHVQVLMTGTSADGKCTTSSLDLSSGEDNTAYRKDNDIDHPHRSAMLDNVTARIPLLASTAFAGVTGMTNSGSSLESGVNSLAKQVRITLPSDSDEDGPDFV